MTVSRLTGNDLGIKLHEEVSAVLAKLVANSYDADATEVEITLPMGKYLAKQEDDDSSTDLGFEIVVNDDGDRGGDGMIVAAQASFSRPARVGSTRARDGPAIRAAAEFKSAGPDHRMR